MVMQSAVEVEEVTEIPEGFVDETVYELVDLTDQVDHLANDTNIFNEESIYRDCRTKAKAIEDRRFEIDEIVKAYCLVGNQLIKKAKQDLLEKTTRLYNRLNDASNVYD